MKKCQVCHDAMEDDEIFCTGCNSYQKRVEVGKCGHAVAEISAIEIDIICPVCRQIHTISIADLIKESKK